MNQSDKKSSNVDISTVKSFGSEWEAYNQRDLSVSELHDWFSKYFSVFPWNKIGVDAVGFDMGCGSGRWAQFVAPRVSKLTCIDPSQEALNVAKENLSEIDNVRFLNCDTETVDLPLASQDFGYSLGVLHHIPDTERALRKCVDLLKPGAPFLVYLYYNFDNRPFWFRAVWAISNLARRVICQLPEKQKRWTTELIALFVYFPLAKLSWLLERAGFSPRNIPLSSYRNSSFYTMRTDSRDRFGTPLEQRFSRAEIARMMEASGLTEVVFSNKVPFWCAVGLKCV